METKATKICDILQKAGFQAVFAGGVVRDSIMGLFPHDIDIATDCSPDEVVSLMKRNRFPVKEVGKAFGVVLVKSGNDEFEIATFRKDIGGSDGRHPDSIEFSSMKEDSFRRDLTINAIFFDPISKQFHDFVEGKKDIENKIVRFVGNPSERIAEDKLRMLRAVRFALKTGFSIHEDTFNALKDFSKEISIIAPERINQELEKMFLCRKPSEMIDILMNTHLMHEILPEIARLENVPQDPKWHKEGHVLTHTKLVMEQLKNESFELQLAGFFHDIGKFSTLVIDETGIHAHGHAEEGAILTEEIMRRLKFSNEQIEHVVFLVKNHMKSHVASQMNKSTLRRFLSTEWADDIIKLCEADEIGSLNEPLDTAFLKMKKEEFSHEIKLPEPLVKGKDLIDLGFKPGPLFKEILDFVMDEQLEGNIFTKEEGIIFIKNKYSV